MRVDTSSDGGIETHLHVASQHGSGIVDSAFELIIGWLSMRMNEKTTIMLDIPP